MQSILQSLNPDQQKAVQILSGPLLILAGAGSGKTKCLTHRTCYLMANGVLGSSILAVTFTNKAANEMKGRIENMLMQYREELSSDSDIISHIPTVGTFHSLCVRILRKHIEHLSCGISNQFVIFDTNDSQQLMKTLMKEHGIDEKTTKFKAVLSHISGAKNQLITPSEYADTVETNRFTQVVKTLYPAYQKRLQEHNALDFDDLLQKTVQLFEASSDVLNFYRKKWSHLMVDEYQDTNFAQYRLVRLLADEHQNLCVIGDDHQSIYSFRGADYTNILNFEKDFPEAAVVKLEQNYRSTSNILTNANALISFNQTGREKNLWTENTPGDPIEVVEVMNEKDEGNTIAERILELKRSSDYSYSDCTILYRMNAQSRAIEEALMRHQIPYQIIGGTRFFDRKEIKDVIAYLRLIFNSRDDVSFLRIINTPSRKLGVATLETLKQYAREYTVSLFEVLEHIDEISELPETKKDVLRSFRDMIVEFQAMSGQEPITILLDRLIEKIQYLPYLDDGTGEGEMRIQNVRELFSVAAKYDGADHSLAAFLEGVALIADVDQYDEASEKVTLMTIHSSKGLEFPVVFLPGWEEGIFPSSSAQFSGEQLEEERRLGYVALTRAKQKCVILHAGQRMLFGRTEYSSPSKFLSELDEKCIERKSTKTPASFNPFARKTFDQGVQRAKQAIFDRVPQTKKEAIFGVAENTSGYKTGDRIRHKEFGEGTIIQVSGDVLSVAFAGIGMKKIVGSVAPIEVIVE